ncbi:MAG: hypothetical protein AB8F94_25045 [Saprospiraceae bacterium]
MKLTFYLLLTIICIACDNPYYTEKPIVNHTGLIETKVLRGGLVWSLDWSPDDQFIACGNAMGLLRIYNVNDLSLVKILTGFNATINSIHWSPDGKKIIASGGNEDPRIILWNLENKSNVIIGDHDRQVRAVRWSPKGNYFASSSHDGTIRIWTPEGEFVKMFTGADGGCVGIDWLDEDKIAASCWDNTIRAYSISGKDSLVIENGNHRRKAVLSVDWHPNGKYLATGDYGNEGDPIHAVKIWNRSGQLITEMNSHEKEIRSLSWNKDGSILASGGETIRTWDKEGKLLKIFEKNRSPVWSLDWNKNGDKLVSGHNDGKIIFWNKEGEILKLLNGHSSRTSSISFAEDSTQLLMGFGDGRLRFFNLKNLTSNTIKAHNRSVLNITWSPNQKHVALSSNDGRASIWKIENETLLNNPVYFGKDIYAKEIAWSTDNSSVAYLDHNNVISVYSIDGKLQYTKATNNENDNSIIWKDGKIAGIKIEKSASKLEDKVRVNVENKVHSLIPLADNEFALIDKDENEIFYGNKKDFIEIIKEENGFTTLKPIK